MRVCQAFAAKIRHRVGFAPDHIVQDPIPCVLQRRPNPKDVVIRSDHPDGAIRLKQSACRLEPVLGEFVIGGETRELVPGVIDRIHLAVVGAMQIALELEIVGRIGKDQINACLWQAVHHLDAIPGDNRVEGERRRALGLGHCRHLLPLSRRLCALVVGDQDESNPNRRQILF